MKKAFNFSLAAIAILLLAIVLFTSMRFSGANQPTTALHYIVREPKIKTTHPPLLILLHGYGSNEEDLFSFADQLPEKYLVISARDPVGLGENRYEWYSIDFSTTPFTNNFKQEEQARQSIIDFINQLRTKYDFDKQQVYLCGFSQGAIMSYSVALTRPDLVHGIAVMSGKVLTEIKPLIASKEKLQQLNVFISHGTRDNKIDIGDAKASVSYLKALGMKPSFHIYDAGHEINAAMLHDLAEWLK